MAGNAAMSTILLSIDSLRIRTLTGSEHTSGILPFHHVLTLRLREA